MLERKWPEKYNRMGHLEWKGRLYGSGHARSIFLGRWRVYHGMWGSGLFQSIYAPQNGHIALLPLMPEWIFLVAALGGLSLLSVLWNPLIVALPLFFAANGVVLGQALLSVSHVRFLHNSHSRKAHAQMRVLTLWLHLIQPLARLLGRVRYGLTPWRRRRGFTLVLPRVKSLSLWSETWRDPEGILRSLESHLRAERVVVLRGGGYDKWDLEVSTGANGSARVQMAVEEHGGGRQMIRFRLIPAPSRRRTAVTLLFAMIAMLPLLDGAWTASIVLGVLAAGFLLVSWLDSSDAFDTIEKALTDLQLGVRR